MDQEDDKTSKSKSNIPSEGQEKEPSKVPSIEQENEPPNVPSKEQAGQPSKVPSNEEGAPPSKIPSAEQENQPSKVPSKAPVSPSVTNSRTSEGGGNMIGEKEGGWVLEKMGRAAGEKGPQGGKSGKVGLGGPSRMGGKCSLGDEDPTTLDPDRDEGWVLEKLYRQINPPCDAVKSSAQLSSKATPSTANANANDNANLSEQDEVSSTVGGPQYVNLNEYSNLYENEGNWVLEKIRTGSGTKATMGFSSMTKTNREKTAGSAGTCPGESSGLGGYVKSTCLDNKRVCRLARQCMVVYDTLTSCDIMGKNECDTVDDEGESIWGWLSGVIEQLFAVDEGPPPAQAEEDQTEGENNNCS